MDNDNGNGNRDFKSRRELLEGAAQIADAQASKMGLKVSLFNDLATGMVIMTIGDYTYMKMDGKWTWEYNPSGKNHPEWEYNVSSERIKSFTEPPEPINKNPASA